MKILVSIVLLSLMHLAVATTQTDAPDREQLKAEVYQMLQSGMGLFENRDFDGLARRFTPDGSLKMPGAPMISGHDALNSHYARSVEQFSGLDFDFAARSLDLSEAGDVAVLIMEFRTRSSNPEDASESSGVILMVLKRVNEEWKIFAESVSAGPVTSFD